MNEKEEAEARAAFRAAPCTYGLPRCAWCNGAGKVGTRLHAGCYDIRPCTRCNGRGVMEGRTDATS